MAQWLGMGTSLGEDVNSVPSRHVGWLRTAGTPAPGGSNTSAIYEYLLLYAHSHTQTHINKNEVNI